ncbi:MAG: NADH-quinone oxidoreductase subunit L [Acidimicrobiales bacterium]|jgi:NADH-quinone oxidoreductase subunit L
MSTTYLAAEAGDLAVQASGFFLENVWVIPAIMAASFAVILGFGKRMPRGGSEVGIAAVGICFVLALMTAGQWIGQVNEAANCTPETCDYIEDEHHSDEGDDHSDEGDDHSDEGDDHSDEGDDHSDEGAFPVGTGGGSADGESASALTAFTEAEEGSTAAAAVAVVSERTWWSNGGIDFTIGTMVDGLTVTLLVVVTLVSMLVHIYSTDYVAGDRRYTHYFGFLSLFTAAMLFFVTSANVLQMIVGWELVGVCSFALIGHWWEDQPNSDAALKAFLTNRVGDIGLLIGMIILFFASNEKWSIIEINAGAIDGTTSHTLLLIASLCLLAAVMSKSGQFFLHTWLPDAMAGPTPVSALIHAATMVVAGVYLIARLYGVFFNGLSIGGSSINALAVIGAVTTLVGASLAFVQDDIKKVLAYSTISQLGYMTLALGVGAWTAAVFHLTTHALFKACLFLGAGSVSHAVHSFDMKKDMGGLRKFMPTTYKTFLIGSIALAGLPPLAGFWSKDEILAGTGGWGFFEGESHANGAYTIMLVMGMITAAMTAAYMTRVMYLTFFGEFRGGHHDDSHAPDDGHADAHHGDPHESGPRILWPLRILAGLAVVAGLMNLPKGFLGLPSGWTLRFEHYVEPLAATGYFPKISHADPSWSLAIFSTLVVASAVGLAYYYYFVRVHAQSPAATELVNGPTERNSLLKAGHTMLKNRYYLDHIYDGGEPVGAAGAGAMGTIFGAAAGLTLGFSLDNGLNQDFWPSLIWGVLLGLTIFTIVSAALRTGMGIATVVKRPMANAANWVHENIIDAAVDEVGKNSVKTADALYKYIDQGVIDGSVNAAGRGSQGAGGELRRWSTGKVQQYATVMFAGATLLAGLLIIVI